MKRYLGMTYASPGFGLPILLRADIYGYGDAWSTLAKALNDEAGRFLMSRDWIVLERTTEGITLEDRIQYGLVSEDVGLEEMLGKGFPIREIDLNGKKKYVPDYNSHAHEENHQEVRGLDLLDNFKYSGPAKAYHLMFIEAIASVIGDLVELEKGDDKDAIKTKIEKNSWYGERLIRIVSKAQRGKTKLQLQRMLNKTYHRQNNERNWAYILHDLMYYGLYSHCIDVMTTHPEEGKEIIFETMRRLKEEPSGTESIQYFRSHFTKRLRIPYLTPFILTDYKPVDYYAYYDNKRVFELTIRNNNDPEVNGLTKELESHLKKIHDEFVSTHLMQIDDPTT